MRSRRPQMTPEQRAEAIRKLRIETARRNDGYRAKALSLLPHVCASCGRELSGKRLKELTVHHKDHNPANNPPDGSNWELLCIYCHDHEHEKTLDAKYIRAAPESAGPTQPGLANPFEKLDSLL